MSYESDSKTVRGINIAILAISILSVILLGIVACSGSVITSAINKYIDDNGSIAADIFEQVDSELVDDLGIFMDDLSSMSAQDVNNLGKAVSEIDASDLRGISQSLNEGDVSPLAALIAQGAQEANVELDAKGLTQMLASLSRADMAELADEISTISETELSEIAIALQSVTPENMNDFRSLINGAQDGKIEQATVNFIWTFIFVAVIIEIIACVVAIVSAVLAMRNCREPQKLTAAFVMAIVSASLAFITGRLISMVLLIISAVFISKVRKVKEA